MFNVLYRYSTVDIGIVNLVVEALYKIITAEYKIIYRTRVPHITEEAFI